MCKLLDYSTNRAFCHYRAEGFFKPHFERLSSRVDRKKVTPLIGAEIEWNPAVRTYNIPSHTIMAKVNRFAILKSDGSLRSGGGEICSRPMDIRAHKVAWKGLFDAIDKDEINVANGRATGLHLHFSKDYIIKEINSSNSGVFSEFIDAMANFMAGNRGFFELVGERPSNHYNQYGSYYTSWHEGAVNRRSSTIEFRIFKSPKKYETLIKDIEFVECFVKFWINNHLYAHGAQPTLLKFLRFINKHSHKYSHLKSFLYKKRRTVYELAHIPTFE